MNDTEKKEEVEEQVITDKNESDTSNSNKESTIESSEQNSESGFNSFAQERIRQREARRLAEQAKKEKREAAELQAKEMQAIMEAISPKSQPMTQKEAKDLVASLALDDYNTGEQVKNYVDMTVEEKVARGIEQALANAEAKRAKERHEEEMKNLPNRLVSEIPDFKKVCTDENYDYLEYHYPEVAKLYLTQPDSYEKWSGLYKTMKKLIPNIDRKQESKKLEENSTRPRSMSTPGSAQTADSAPFMLSREKKAQNWERMQRQMRGG